jgi:hypothetical protein
VTLTPLYDLSALSQAEYHIVIVYGTLAQKLSVEFDTRAGGPMFLQCKLCG